MKNSDKDARKHGRKEDDARVDEAGAESFPASDAPAWTSGAPRSGESAAAAPARHQYAARQELRPKDLPGISENQISQHWKLYEGYVKNTNLLNEKLAALAAKKDFGPEFAEMKRRLGFEYDGMILHEHYFGVLKAGQKPLGEDSPLTKQLKKSFGGFSNWRDEFTAIGKMRGVGWAILYFDPRERALTNHWIGLHEDGHPAGFIPILVMDVWEHAYMV
ncbi:MAG TPA: Fe-Mn family superoxide dismutase, partial [Elusimicrobiota bacterium]|nr:Fe-Mn family superoxide dismutase [Elusimicrobiota bacterium]